MCRLLSDQKKSSFSLFLTLQEDQWRRGAVGEQVLHLSPQSRPPPPPSQSRRKPCTRQSSCWEEVGQRRPLLSSLILNCWVKQEGAYHHQKGSRQFFAFQPLERSLVPNNSVFSDNDDILYRLLFDSELVVCNFYLVRKDNGVFFNHFVAGVKKTTMNYWEESIGSVKTIG